MALLFLAKKVAKSQKQVYNKLISCRGKTEKGKIMKKYLLPIISLIILMSMMILTGCQYELQLVKKTTSTTKNTTNVTTTVSNDAPDDPKDDLNYTHEETPMDFMNMDLTQYIQLGQYKGLEIVVEQTEVSAEQVEMQIDILLAQAGEYAKIKENAIVENGTILSFDYKGYYQNEEGTKGNYISNCSGTDQLACIDGKTLLTISSSGTGSFIDGFAEGMIGKKPGDKFDLEITFPEVFHTAELAGKKAIFEIEISYIAQTNYSDAWVKKFTSETYSNYADFYNYIKDDMTSEIESTNLDILWDTILKNGTVIKIPEQQLNYIYTVLVADVDFYVAYSWYYWGQQLDFEQVLNKLGFATVKEFDEYAKNYAIEMIKYDLLMYAIIQAEGLEVTDEEYELFLEELIEISGKTREEVITSYGGEESIKETLLGEKLDEFILSENDFVCVMTWEEYVAAEIDSKVVIEAYVQGNQSWWDNKMCIYAQDGIGGYYLYNFPCSEEMAAQLVPGTKIRVYGYKAEWQGLIEIVGDNLDPDYSRIEIIEGNYVAEPANVTNLLGKEELVNYQNMLVKFEGLTVANIDYKYGTPGDDIYVTFNYNGANYVFMVERYLTGPETSLYELVTSLKAGDIVDVEGFAYWYNGINTHITNITVR